MRKKDLTPKNIFLARQILWNYSGFTLVELITTLVIIAIMAVFVAPDVISWQTNMRVSSAVRDLYGALNSARVSAVERNANIVVAVAATPANTFSIFVDDGSGGGVAGNGVKDGTEIELINSPFNQKTAGKDYRDAHINNVTIAGTIGFTPRGMPIGNNTGNILIRNTASNRWFIILLNVSGSLTLLQSTDSTNGTNGTWN